MIDRRELRRDAKARVTAKGAFAVRCTASGEAWVSSSGDLNSTRTGIWFLLRNGMHHNKRMQAAWNLHGADAFQFDILETLDENFSPLFIKDSLRERQKHWEKELGASVL